MKNTVNTLWKIHFAIERPTLWQHVSNAKARYPIFGKLKDWLETVGDERKQAARF